MSDLPGKEIPFSEPTAIRDSTIFVADAVIPERYKTRMEAAMKTDVAPLLDAMGIERSPEGMRFPISGVKARLEKFGIESQFDFRGLYRGIIPQRVYLSTIRDGYVPLGLEEPAHIWHDAVFHGTFFATVDKNIGDLIKSAADRALLSQDKKVMDDCVNAIDASTGFFLGAKITDIDFATELKAGIKQLAPFLGVSIIGEDMFQNSRAQKKAEEVSANASQLAQDGAKHFDRVLSKLKTK